jgi:hypothetical protein
MSTRPSHWVFDESAEPMQAEELEKYTQNCDRSKHIYWFQNGKWP